VDHIYITLLKQGVDKLREPEEKVLWMLAFSMSSILIKDDKPKNLTQEYSF